MREYSPPIGHCYTHPVQINIPMQILALSTFGERCGIATYNDALVQAIREKGHSVDIHPVDVTTARKLSVRELPHCFDDFEARLAGYDALVIQHEYGLFGGRFPSGVAQKVFAQVMKSVVAAGKPTAIIFHSEPRTSRRFLSKKRHYWKRIRTLINQNPRIFTVVHGETARQQYLEAGLLEPAIWSIRHPLPEPRKIKKKKSSADFTLTIFGFVAKYKGYDEILAALDLLPGKYRLLIAGGEHPGNTLDDTYRRLQEAQDPRVEITGWLEEEDIPAIMERTDIVLAPYHENGPAGSGAVTWGICHGRPIVASRTITFREIQEEAGCFELVSPKDPKALAEAIERVATDKALQKRLADNGLAYARDHSWTAMAEGLLERLGGS